MKKKTKADPNDFLVFVIVGTPALAAIGLITGLG